GDRRGFVSNVADAAGKGHRNNVPGTRCDQDIRGLHSFAERQLADEPVWLERDQASALADQFRETAHYQGWDLLAAAIMRNHVHIVIRVEGDPAPDTLRRDFKSYGSRPSVWAARTLGGPKAV